MKELINIIGQYFKLEGIEHQKWAEGFYVQKSLTSLDLLFIVRTANNHNDGFLTQMYASPCGSIVVGFEEYKTLSLKGFEPEKKGGMINTN